MPNKPVEYAYTGLPIENPFMLLYQNIWWDLFFDLNRTSCDVGTSSVILVLVDDAKIAIVTCFNSVDPMNIMVYIEQELKLKPLPISTIYIDEVDKKILEYRKNKLIWIN